MKVAFVGNLAGVANENVVGLRDRGVTANVFVRASERAQTTADLDPASRFREEWLRPMPSYERVFAARGAARAAVAAAELAREVRAIAELASYDIIHCHTGALLAGRIVREVYVRRHAKPLIAAATGSDLREVAARGTGVAADWMRRFFLRADRVFLLNIDMPPIARSLGLGGASFFPFAIDTERYSPRVVQRRYCDANTLLFFMMSRLDWSGRPEERTSANENNRVFHAFARFCETGDRAHLVVSDRGRCRDAAHELVAHLGISDHVEFVPEMSQAERIEHMLMADVCFDQFGLGAYGLGALETMACGKPLVTYVRPTYAEECELAPLPILSAQSEDEILDAMRRASSRVMRETLGHAARNWVLRFHARDVVADKLVDCYSRILAARRRAA